MGKKMVNPEKYYRFVIIEIIKFIISVFFVFLFCALLSVIEFPKTDFVFSVFFVIFYIF